MSFCETQFNPHHVLWSGFDYEGLLGLGMFEDETGTIEIKLESRSVLEMPHLLG